MAALRLRHDENPTATTMMHQQAQAIASELRVTTDTTAIPETPNPLQTLQVQLSLKQIQQDQKYLLLKQELQ
ncbi:MAG: hypothetical protein ACLS3V_04560 [Streptococcus sp.]